MKSSTPDYRKIFEDIIMKNCPTRIHEFSYYIEKKQFSIMDVITLNSKIFNLSDRDTHHFNQKHKSYDEQTILEILNYQKKHKLNNIELATHFSLSRNTVTKWRRQYLKELA